MKTKVCRVCSEEKTVDLLVKRSDRKNQCRNLCISCHNLSTKSYYHENKDVRKDYNKSWRDNNKTLVKENSKAYYAANKEKFGQYIKEWRKANQDRLRTYSASRRASQKQALPTWLTEDQMRQIDSIYTHAKDCEVVSGQTYHVDHIVPLKGENVCGLHVPWNLQVLPSDVNLSKHNNFNGW
jgi:hypothetical protein